MSEHQFLAKLSCDFVVNVEAVPPAEPTCMDLALRIAQAVQGLSVDAINLADSPLACPRMSPVLFAGALRTVTSDAYTIIPHITVRDRNRVALQGLIWGVVAAGIEAVLIVSGDPVRYSSVPGVREVADLSVPDLVRIATQQELTAGVVLDPRVGQLEREKRKLEKKVEAGAGFVITQPLFDLHALDLLARALEPFRVPVLLGILPLVSRRHAHFLHDHVPGIDIPAALLYRVDTTEDPLKEGVACAQEMLAGARDRLAGVCIMPPFHRFGLVSQIIGPGGRPTEVAGP